MTRLVVKAPLSRIGLGFFVIVTLSGCDPYVERDFKNDCGFDIEAKYTIPDCDRFCEGPPTLIAAGDSENIGTVDWEIDVAVRVPGDVGWAITITWEEVEEQAPDSMDEFVLHGPYCPTPAR